MTMYNASTYTYSTENLRCTKYRKGKKKLIIPTNGSQKFEVKNLDDKERKIIVRIYSGRFRLSGAFEQLRNDEMLLQMALQPGHSIVFVIKDTGEMKAWIQEFGDWYFEGVLRVGFEKFQKERKPRGDKLEHFITDHLIDLDKEDTVYTNERASKDSGACQHIVESDPNDPLNKLLSLEIWDEKKYEKIPDTVHMLNYTEVEKPKPKKVVAEEADPESDPEPEKPKKKKKKCIIS